MIYFSLYFYFIIFIKKIHISIIIQNLNKYNDNTQQTQVIKYYKSNRTMDLTNNKLGDLIFACEKTVRNSINNLCGAGLITKEKIKNRRILEYIPYKNYA